MRIEIPRYYVSRNCLNFCSFVYLNFRQWNLFKSFHPGDGLNAAIFYNLWPRNAFKYCFGARQMKLLTALFIVLFSQLLGANVYASQSADSGKVGRFLRHIEKPRSVAKGSVINKVGLIHHLCHPVRVEDENEENLYKKLSSTGSLVLCFTAPSWHYTLSFANSLFLSRPLSSAASCRYIVHRVLRI